MISRCCCYRRQTRAPINLQMTPKHIDKSVVSQYEKPSSPYCAMVFFWWSCRGNSKLITLGSDQVLRNVLEVFPEKELGCSRWVEKERRLFSGKQRNLRQPWSRLVFAYAPHFGSATVSMGKRVTPLSRLPTPTPNLGASGEARSKGDSSDIWFPNAAWRLCKSSIIIMHIQACEHEQVLNNETHKLPRCPSFWSYSRNLPVVRTPICPLKIKPSGRKWINN